MQGEEKEDKFIEISSLRRAIIQMQDDFEFKWLGKNCNLNFFV